MNVFMLLIPIEEQQFNSQIAIKKQLKHAVTNLAQPLLMDLYPCPKCYIKHYKQECM